MAPAEESKRTFLCRNVTSGCLKESSRLLSLTLTPGHSQCAEASIAMDTWIHGYLDNISFMPSGHGLLQEG